jgi:protein O-mannosyl-transferase
VTDTVLARDLEAGSALAAPAVSRSALRFVLPLVVVAVTLLAFLPVLDAGFLSWDDETNFLDNPHYRGLGWAQLRWMFTSARLGHYVPVTWISFGLSYVLGGMNPRGYHLANLLLHAANSAVFYVVARRLLAAAFGGGVTAPPASDHGRAGFDVELSLGAAFAALIFGVHPLRVESVAWVTERRDVLCGLFSLLTVAAYLTALRRGAPARLHAGWYWTAIGCFALALLSKSTAVTLPLVLLVADVYPLGRISFGGSDWRPRAGRLVREKFPFLVMSAGITATMVVIGWRSVLTPLGTLGITDRIAISAYGLVSYLWKTVAPWPLSPLYELRHPVRSLTLPYLSATALVVITVTAIALRRRWPAALAAWLAYALFLLPVIGIAQNGMQITADRYSYLSCLGFAVLAGGTLAWLLRERGRFKATVVTAAILAGVLVIAGWAGSTWRQSKIWHDSETLWRWALDVDPDCVVCRINLGAELVASPSPDAGRAREAEGLFRRAIMLNADRDFAYHGLGVALAAQHRYPEAEAAFREYMRREPSSAVGFIQLGQLYLSQHRSGEAIPFFRRALTLKPTFPTLPGLLAQALRERGEELQREGRQGEGEALVAEAAALQGK